METPSSARRVTRSQALASATNSNIPISRKVEDCDNNGLSKQRNRKMQDLPTAMAQDRSALVEITNDSPIVGLATGNLKTPLSAVTKKIAGLPKMMTPGSGEALLRGQVKTLLQKVEEEAEISKIALESRNFICLHGVVNSPVGLLAPTPANTPQVSNLSQVEVTTAVSSASTPIVEEQRIFQVVNDLFDGKSEENQITRSLLLDFSDKSELTDASSDCSSVLTHQELKEKPSPEDDNSSIWSMQANASTHDEEEEEEDYAEEEEEGGLVDELCEGLRRIRVNDKGKAVEFAGRHTRFLYDSEDELIEEVCDESGGGGGGGVSAGVLRLKGLPTPKGKHLRFPAEDGDGDGEVDG